MSMKTRKKQKLMNKANHKPVSESARPPVEQISRCKAFAGIKASSDNLIESHCLQFEHFW